MAQEIKIIYQKGAVMAVDKPADWVTTDEGRNENNRTIESWLKINYQETNHLSRHGLVHRLDKGTSGIVLVALNQVSLEKLKKQFKKRLVKKQYWAVAGGKLPAAGEIDMPIGRSKYGFAKFRVEWDGKRAITQFRVIKYFYIGSKVYSLIEIDLKTGRTHQIRVHMKYMGWPLLGDKTYGGDEIEGLDRQFLHAKKIELDDGERISIESPLADDLLAIIKRYAEI